MPSSTSPYPHSLIEVGNVPPTALPISLHPYFPSKLILNLIQQAWKHQNEYYWHQLRLGSTPFGVPTYPASTTQLLILPQRGITTSLRVTTYLKGSQRPPMGAHHLLCHLVPLLGGHLWCHHPYLQKIWCATNTNAPLWVRHVDVNSIHHSSMGG